MSLMKDGLYKAGYDHGYREGREAVAKDLDASRIRVCEQDELVKELQARLAKATCTNEALQSGPIDQDAWRGPCDLPDCDRPATHVGLRCDAHRADKAQPVNINGLSYAAGYKMAINDAIDCVQDFLDRDNDSESLAHALRALIEPQCAETPLQE